MRQTAATATADQGQPKHKLAFIDGMRGAAALYVVLGHICVMVDPNLRIGKPSATPDWLQALMAPFWYGHLAVAAFIVISGFCLQMSLFERSEGWLNSPLAFFSRRARRILPAYYACLAFSLLVVWAVTQPLSADPRFAQYLPIAADNLIAHILMYHNLDPGWMYKINGVLWSIAIEAQLYVLFPLLWIGVFHVGRFIFAGLCGLLVWYMLGFMPAKLYLWYGALFVVGMAFAHLAYRPVLRWGTRPRIATPVGVALVLLACWASADRGLEQSLGPAMRPVLGDVLIGVGTAVLLYAGLVAPWSLPARVFRFLPLAAIGIFSYSLYLFHHPLQQLLYVLRPGWAAGPENEVLYLVAIGLPVILVASYLFYRLFERPFMTARRRRAEKVEESQIIKRQPVEGVVPTAVALSARSAYGVGRRRQKA